MSWLAPCTEWEVQVYIHCTGYLCTVQLLMPATLVVKHIHHVFVHLLNNCQLSECYCCHGCKLLLALHHSYGVFLVWMLGNTMAAFVQVFPSFELLLSRSGFGESVVKDATSHPAADHWWTTKGWGKWVIFRGRSYCFKFSSVMWPEGHPACCSS